VACTVCVFVVLYAPVAMPGDSLVSIQHDVTLGGEVELKQRERYVSPSRRLVSLEYHRTRLSIRSDAEWHILRGCVVVFAESYPLPAFRRTVRIRSCPQLNGPDHVIVERSFAIGRGTGLLLAVLR
jgi:hypothetical protein